MTSIEYFKKQLGRLRRSLYYAEQRNDENAIKGLRDKMRYISLMAICMNGLDNGGPLCCWP